LFFSEQIISTNFIFLSIEVGYYHSNKQVQEEKKADDQEENKE